MSEHAQMHILLISLIISHVIYGSQQGPDSFPMFAYKKLYR